MTSAVLLTRTIDVMSDGRRGFVRPGPLLLVVPVAGLSTDSL